jgi:hypothetical protein
VILLAAVLTASINVDIDLSRLVRKAQSAPAQVTCGITTVGYRFRGAPGQQFRYAGDTYKVPAEGWVELIADKKKTTYAVNGSSLPLDVWPRDQFGFRDVPLPGFDAQPKGESK